MNNGSVGPTTFSEQEGISSFVELRQRARSVGPKRVAVVVADDEVGLTAAEEALNLGIAHRADRQRTQCSGQGGTAKA